jgi:hypothetical protein
MPDNGVLRCSITDTKAPSYRGTDPMKVLMRAEDEKKNKHLKQSVAARGQFTPLCFSVDGLMGPEAQAACKRLASHLSFKWKRAYSHLCGFVRSRIVFCLVWALSVCLRGSRDPTRPHRTFQWEDGSGLCLYH